jgi:transposase
MPVHQVGKLFKLSDYKIWDILEGYVYNALISQLLEGISAIGIDETSLKKWHNYISLFVDLAEKRTLFVTEGKDHSTVTDFTEFLIDHGGKTVKI